MSERDGGRGQAGDTPPAEVPTSEAPLPVASVAVASAAGAEAGETMIGGSRGRRLQVRRRSRRAWTEAAKTRFLEVLATTCNVALAAEAAGHPRNSAYALRTTDPAFAEAWQVALAESYDHLERRLIAGAIGATDAGRAMAADAIAGAEAADGPIADPQLAITLLKLHRGADGKRTGGAAPRRLTRTELIAELMPVLARAARHQRPAG